MESMFLSLRPWGGKQKKGDSREGVCPSYIRTGCGHSRTGSRGEWADRERERGTRSGTKGRTVPLIGSLGPGGSSPRADGLAGTRTGVGFFFQRMCSSLLRPTRESCKNVHRALYPGEGGESGRHGVSLPPKPPLSPVCNLHLRNVRVPGFPCAEGARMDQAR